jgi:hypothetical protein
MRAVAQGSAAGATLSIRAPRLLCARFRLHGRQTSVESDDYVKRYLGERSEERIARETTPNAEHRMSKSDCCIRRWAFGVGRSAFSSLFLHPRFKERRSGDRRSLTRATRHCRSARFRTSLRPDRSGRAPSLCRESRANDTSSDRRCCRSRQDASDGRRRPLSHQAVSPST